MYLRQTLINAINAGGIVILDGKVMRHINQVPTQLELDDLDNALATRRDAVLPGVGRKFANLPTGVVGMKALITDSTVNTWGTIIAGGGANTVLAFFNGTNWTVFGK